MSKSSAQKTARRNARATKAKRYADEADDRRKASEARQKECEKEWKAQEAVRKAEAARVWEAGRPERERIAREEAEVRRIAREKRDTEEAEANRIRGQTKDAVMLDDAGHEAVMRPARRSGGRLGLAMLLPFLMMGAGADIPPERGGR